MAHRPTLVDLSKTTRLKGVSFRVDYLRHVDWITMELQSLTPKHHDLQQISIELPYNMTFAVSGANIVQTISDENYGQWLDLDRILVRFWESHSIRPVMKYPRPKPMQSMRVCIESLLPEATRRGIMEMVEW